MLLKVPGRALSNSLFSGEGYNVIINFSLLDKVLLVGLIVHVHILGGVSIYVQYVYTSALDLLSCLVGYTAKLIQSSGMGGHGMFRYGVSKRVLIAIVL